MREPPQGPVFRRWKVHKDAMRTTLIKQLRYEASFCPYLCFLPCSVEDLFVVSICMSVSVTGQRSRSQQAQMTLISTCLLPKFPTRPHQIFWDSSSSSSPSDQYILRIWGYRSRSQQAQMILKNTCLLPTTQNFYRTSSDLHRFFHWQTLSDYQIFRGICWKIKATAGLNNFWTTLELPYNTPWYNTI